MAFPSCDPVLLSSQKAHSAPAHCFLWDQAALPVRPRKLASLRLLSLGFVWLVLLHLHCVSFFFFFFFFWKMIFIVIHCVWVFACMRACVLYVHSAHGDQKSALDLLGLGLLHPKGRAPHAMAYLLCSPSHSWVLFLAKSVITLRTVEGAI